MELLFRGFRTEVGSPINEALSATRYYTSRDRSEPWLYAYAPVARMNPYQALMHRSFGEHGLAVSPVTEWGAFDRLTALSGQTRGVVLHLHWLSEVLKGARTEADAQVRAADFLSRLQAFRSEGGRVVWTVHNMAPHDAKFLEEERRLQQAVADEADLVHVMSEDTPQLVSDFLALDPEKTFCVPHPSYEGAYQDFVPRDHARLVLGIDPDEVVYVAFGAIKAYKGIERFVEGFNHLLKTSQTPRRLIIAGKADGDRSSQQLVKQLRMHPYVLLKDAKVPAEHVQYMMRAADLMVLPHQRALNSGGALLGPTFDLPVVANRVGVLPNLLEPSFAEFLEGSTPEEIAASLERADRLVAPEARAAARDFADRHRPADVSDRFAREVRERLSHLSQEG